MTVHDITILAPAGKGLAYNGTAIRDKGEMLSLTDMWKAAGEPENKNPAQWSRSAGAADFIDHVALIVGISHNNLIDARKRAGTWAHWQIGLAYAKYLNPEFHMWCNSVARAHMEGKPVVASVGLTAEDRSVIGGIVKACAGVVIREQLENLLPAMIEPMVAARLASSTYLLRSGKTAKQIWDICGLPPNIKGSAVWFGNRLKKGGCMLEGRADRGDKAIRLFDPDKAEALLGLGLRQHARSYASNRLGKPTDGLFAIQGGLA